MDRGACMFMICSNVAKRARDVKPQGNGVMRDRATPSLDVRDVEDEHSGCQNRGCPDESRIRGFVHDDSCTYKSCARTITAALTSVKMARKRSIPVEVLSPTCRENHPRFPHAAAVLEVDQAVRNGVFPNG